MPTQFTEDYIDQCFHVWYAANQPINMEILQELLPDNKENGKPSRTTLKAWVTQYGWHERADAMNALVTQKVETNLMEEKFEMLKRHAQRAASIAEKAYEHLLEQGFDTSNSAATAYFKAAEEERTVTGIGKMMMKISKATDDELKQEAYKLLKRVNAVDGEVIEVDSESESVEKDEDTL